MEINCVRRVLARSCIAALFNERAKKKKFERKYPNMKKLLSLLLALALVFSLAACSSKTDDMTTDDT